LREHGVDAEVASRYVTEIFAGVAERLASGDDLEALVHAHATPGGNNERFDSLLQQAGVFDHVSRSLSAVYQRLTAVESTRAGLPLEQGGLG
jgi:pyrroline-5-carboxylate reductase